MYRYQCPWQNKKWKSYRVLPLLVPFIASTLADNLYRLWANYSIVAYVAWLALILLLFSLCSFIWKLIPRRQFIFLATQFAIRFLYKNPIRIINLLTRDLGRFHKILIGASLSEPHINVLNASDVCLYVCMYVCMYVYMYSYVVP